MVDYRCSVCGVAVIVLREGDQTKIIRPCPHNEAAVNAFVKAHAKGTASLHGK